MHVAVVGPLEVLTPDSVPVAFPDATDRLLLAVLAAASPRVVATEELVAVVCDGEPADAARAVLHEHIAHLRTALEPVRPANSSGRYVLRRGAGYVLAVDRGDVDASRLAALATRGRAQLVAGDPAEALRLLTAALGLWRGEPYCEWPHAAFDEERRRLCGVRARAEDSIREARRRLDRPTERGPAPLGPPPRLGGPARDPVAAEPPDEPDPPAEARPPALDVEWPAGGPSWPRARAGLLAAALLVPLVFALVAARATSRSGLEAERAVREAAADRVAALSRSDLPLDVAFLLAVEAFRRADTPRTRDALLDVLTGHERVQRAVSFNGAAQDAVLTGGGPTLTFGIGTSVVAWPVVPLGQPYVLMAIPGAWGAWLVVAPSPTEDVVMGAGVGPTGSWLRLVSAQDGSSRLLLEGDAVGGRPVDGAVGPDGRRLLLLVAEPDAGNPNDATRWRLVEVDAADGTRRDTGIAGSAPVPTLTLRADFADDAGSFVLWDLRGRTAPVLVDVTGGRQTPVAVRERDGAGTGFRALSSGAAQLRDDGTVVLLDRAGSTVQELGHLGPVHDVAVSPDGTWAVTVGAGGEVVRWEVHPSNGRWSEPERLAGHRSSVMGVEADADGRTVVTVSADHTVVSWDMSRGADEPGRPDDPAAWVREACAIAGRDLTPAEWQRFVPGPSWQPTCTDLP